MFCQKNPTIVDFIIALSCQNKSIDYHNNIVQIINGGKKYMISYSYVLKCMNKFNHSVIDK